MQRNDRKKQQIVSNLHTHISVLKRRSKKEHYAKANIIIWKSFVLQKKKKSGIDRLKHNKTKNNGCNKRFYCSRNISIGLKKGQLI